MSDYDAALVAARRCARRLEKLGINHDAIADAFFAEAAGRWSALTGEAESIQKLALMWTAIGAVAVAKGALN